MACMEHECRSCGNNWFNNINEYACPKCGEHNVTNWSDEPGYDEDEDEDEDNWDDEDEDEDEDEWWDEEEEDSLKKGG